MGVLPMANFWLQILRPKSIVQVLLQRPWMHVLVKSTHVMSPLCAALVFRTARQSGVVSTSMTGQTSLVRAPRLGAQLDEQIWFMSWAEKEESGVKEFSQSTEIRVILSDN